MTWRLLRPAYTRLLLVAVLLAVAGGLAVFVLRPAAVSVTEVTRRDIAPAVQGVGTVEVKVVVQVSSKITGRIVAVLVDQGDLVEIGQLQSLQFRVGPTPFRVQLVGHRLGALGSAPAVVAGRPILYSRYEMVLGREAGVPLGTEIRIGRMVFTIVGLTEGIVSTAGDPVAFVSLHDAQEIQFLKANEAVRNDRARLEADLQSEPALANVPATTLGPIVQNTHLANAVLVRLEPWADPNAVRDHIERWNHYRALTEAQQEEVLAKSVIERGRRQRFFSGPSSSWCPS